MRLHFVLVLVIGPPVLVLVLVLVLDDIGLVLATRLLMRQPKGSNHNAPIIPFDLH